MCRFVSFLSKQPVVLERVLISPNNSLIKQSKAAREEDITLNADGFGIAWYNRSIDPYPGVYKSIQPAWNDENLHHLATKIRSSCFLGHVRDSSIGSVNTYNCHPFTYENFSFMHNGNIDGIKLLRRSILESLSDIVFDNIKGQTDSELFFAIILDYMQLNSTEISWEVMQDAVLHSINKINSMQKKLPGTNNMKLNIVVSDGEQMLATRYNSSTTDLAPSLYYCTKENSKSGEVLIASEPLDDYSVGWREVPTNHFVNVTAELECHIAVIDN